MADSSPRAGGDPLLVVAVLLQRSTTVRDPAVRSVLVRLAREDLHAIELRVAAIEVQLRAVEGDAPAPLLTPLGARA